MQWSDVTPEEQAAIKQFCTDTITNLPAAYVTHGCTNPGKILDVILGGSWGSGIANTMSDYDIFFVADRFQPFVINPDPNGYSKNLMKQYLTFFANHNYSAVTRLIDAKLLSANGYYDLAKNPNFGFSLMDGTNYPSVVDLIAKYPPLEDTQSGNGAS